MNDLAIRVARLCPSIFEIHHTHRDGRLVEYVTRGGDEDLIEVDPTSDLNSCHSFEEGMNAERRADYMFRLRDIVEGRTTRGCFSLHEALQCTFATAAQRCRAFMEVMEASSVPKGNEVR